MSTYFEGKILALKDSIANNEAAYQDMMLDLSNIKALITNVNYTPEIRAHMCNYARELEGHVERVKDILVAEEQLVLYYTKHLEIENASNSDVRH